MNSASDAHYASLLRSLSAERVRRAESIAAYERGERRHWYFLAWDYCPVCGREDGSRTRVYGPKPKRREDRVEYMEHYDYCQE